MQYFFRRERMLERRQPMRADCEMHQQCRFIRVRMRKWSAKSHEQSRLRSSQRWKLCSTSCEPTRDRLWWYSVKLVIAYAERWICCFIEFDFRCSVHIIYLSYLPFRTAWYSPVFFDYYIARHKNCNVSGKHLSNVKTDRTRRRYNYRFDFESNLILQFFIFDNSPWH